MEREICVQQLEGFKNLVESRLSASQTDRIRAEYNTLAAQNGWPPINNYDLDKANQSPARFPQRFKALFDIVMKEVRREPFTAYRMEEELEKQGYTYYGLDEEKYLGVYCTSLPKGERASFASLKCIFPNGMPMMVMQNMKP